MFSLPHWLFVISQTGILFVLDRPIYYLTDASALIHGISADRLGGGGYDFKTLLYGMTTRNHAPSTSVWAFWDAVGIADPDMQFLGWCIVFLVGLNCVECWVVLSCAVVCSVAWQ